jgi:transmembrane sensor
MTKYIAKELLEKYIQAKCTEEERAIVESWHLKELENKVFKPAPGQIENAHKSIWQSIQAKAAQKKATLLPGTWYRYAAALALITLSVGIFLFIQGKFNRPSVTDLLVKTGNDASPGGNKAILTLADGSSISLNDATNGNLARQAGITITKAKEGEVVYHIDTFGEKKQPLINTIHTPRGGNYQISLPDGSKVWLNAESSLKFPTFFVGDERKVTLTGEAYFEVAKNERQPFVVQTSLQEVKVLGTHFNINSYEDEDATKTTLLEGSVKVSTAQGNTILKPGEQSRLNPGQLVPLVISIDVEHEMAWKNGMFIFKDEPIESIIRKLSRWYNVEIEIEDRPSGLSLTGAVSRLKNISSVLRIMEGTGNIHFKTEGKKIIIIN